MLIIVNSKPLSYVILMVFNAIKQDIFEPVLPHNSIISLKVGIFLVLYSSSIQVRNKYGTHVNDSTGILRRYVSSGSTTQSPSYADYASP